MEAPVKWPIRPDHISIPSVPTRIDPRGLDETRDPLFADLQKLNGVGIVFNEYLKTLLTSITNATNKPVIMVEFPPGSDHEVVITQALSIEYEANLACRQFRKYTYRSVCKECEKRYANTFRPHPVTAHSAPRNLPASPQIVTASNRELQKKHKFIEFNCPALGYRKFAVPVYVDRKVVGVLMGGRVCLTDRLKDIKNSQVSYFFSNPGCFRSYCATNKDVTPSSCIQAIQDSHEKWVADETHVYDGNKYYEDVGRVLDEVIELEKLLLYEISAKREKYISAKIGRCIQKFYSAFPPQNITGDDLSYDRLCASVGDCLEDIKDDFSLKSLCIFGSKTLTKRQPSKLQIMAHAGEVSCGGSSVKNDLEFDIEKIPSMAKESLTTSLEVPGLFKGFEASDISPQTNFIRTFPVSPKHIIVTWATYDDEVWNPITRDVESGQALEREIRSFYTIIASFYSAIVAAKSREMVKATLRIYGHEAGQLIAGIDWIRTIYLGDPNTIKRIEQGKLQDISKDLEDFLKQMSMVFSKANMSIMMPEPEKSRFLPFKELIFKWKDVYRVEVERKSLQFVIPYPDPDDPYRQHIYADLSLLEQLVYNLVNNAVKYSYRGTKIHLDCRKTGTSRTSPTEIVGTNYGIQMSGESFDPYELYARGQNVQLIDGLGVGLYLVARIAEAHNGNVRHRSTLISNFNVPLIVPYLKSGHPALDKEIRPKLEQELKRLKQLGEYEKIVALKEDRKLKLSTPSPGELAECIRRKTWRVTFVVTIP